MTKLKQWCYMFYPSAKQSIFFLFVSCFMYDVVYAYKGTSSRLGSYPFTYYTGDTSRRCVDQLKSLPGKYDYALLKKACSKVSVKSGCVSRKGTPIYHYESLSKSKGPAKRIIVLSLIHGDETESGSVARRWMTRLEKISSRNHWRIVPVVNPDGWEKNSRVNEAGVDINRNFPTADWDKLAVKLWKKRYKSNPRRNPGPSAGSELETRCVMKHMDDFQPDFVIAIHTPYGVLDYDGPSVPLPKFSDIPWVRLGTFPGSLGRYMWVDRNVPVLTVELKDSKILAMIDRVDRLQDISGTVAIRSYKQNTKKPQTSPVSKP